jgi:hypothetical protein
MKLNQRILTLETGYSELTNLSAELSQSNENLKVLNEQIAERMQERDEDLAWAYDTIDKQKIKILEKDNTILRMAIAIGILGLIILAAIVITILKFYGKITVPWLKL